MTRKQYLSQPVVQGFVLWLSELINSDFQHQYFARRKKKIWQCNSILEAVDGEPGNGVLRGYEWNGLDYKQTTKKLLALQEEARNGLTKKSCSKIIKWGGIRRDSLHYMGSDIVKYLEDAKKRLNPRTFNLDRLDNLPHMNSSYTKIYSLLLDDFIIYDSRVGAALGFLVKRFYAATKRKFIRTEFEQLNFAWGLAQSSKEKSKNELIARSRNPSEAQFVFPQLTSLPSGAAIKLHTISNIRASWLLKAVVQAAKHRSFNIRTDGLRKLEAGLFMIGYDIWQEIGFSTTATVRLKPDPIPLITTPVMDKPDAKKGMKAYSTLGRAGTIFQATLDSYGIRAVTGSGTIVKLDKKAIASLLKHFSNQKSFKLGASRTAPSENGMGIFLKKNYGKSPGDASHIAAVLAEHGYVTTLQSKHGVLLKVLKLLKHK